MNSYEREEEAQFRALRSGAPARSRDPSPHLVSTDWLARQAPGGKLAVFEVSLDACSAEGHIPGAIPLDWAHDLLDQVRRDIVDRERLEQVLQSAGVDEDATIVLYGDCNNWFAAFAAWVFGIYGLTDVRLLDGGRAKWLAEDRPLSTRFPRPGLGDVRLQPADLATRAFLADVLEASGGRSGAQLVDVRSPDEFEGRRTAPPGEAEGAMRAGHVPAATNIPWGRLVAADGTFKPVEELRRIFAERGVDGSAPVITYCRIGERSGHSWFALSRLLGYRARNYDGSWAEYGNVIGAPIENPSA